MARDTMPDVVLPPIPVFKPTKAGSKKLRERLKGRSPFVSIHTMKEVADLRIPHRVICRLSEDLPELHAKLVTDTQGPSP